MSERTSAQDIQTSGLDFDPSSLDSLAVAYREMNKSISKGMRVCIPAVVMSYDRDTRRASVLPLVKYGYRGNDKYEWVTRLPIDVSVHSHIRGGFAIDMPLLVGDVGWLIASDWDTDALRSVGSETAALITEDVDSAKIERTYAKEPTTTAIHSLKDGFFIPDSWGVHALEAVKDVEPDDGGDNGLSDALYIGSAVGSDSKGEVRDSYLEGDSGSLTVKRNGEMRMFHSKPQDEDFRNGLTVHADGMSLSVDDGGNKVKNSVEMVSDETVMEATDEANEKNASVSVGTEAVEAEATDGESTANVTIAGGKVTVSLGGSEALSATSDGGVTVVINCKTASIVAPSINLSGDVNITGSLNVSGKVTLGGGVTMLGSDVTIKEVGDELVYAPA